MNRDYSNWTIADIEQMLLVNGTNNATVVSCKDGWIYDQTLYHSTAATEVCIIIIEPIIHLHNLIVDFFSPLLLYVKPTYRKYSMCFTH